MKKKNAEDYYLQGEQFAGENEDKAIRAFSKAIKLNPEYAEASYARGYSYAVKGNFTAALKDFDRAIKNKPDYADAYLVRGHVFLDIGDTAKANADFAKSKSLGIVDPVYY